MKLTKKVISGVISISLSVTLLTGIPFNVGNNGIKARAESVIKASTATILDTDVASASDGCTMLGVYGSYYSQAQDALDRINEIRKEACEAGNVPYPGEPSRMLEPGDYVPVKWSADLESIARIRAMEGGLAFSFSLSGHSRLNKKEIWSVQYNGVKSYAENLAYNWGTSMVSGINQWYKEKGDWINQEPGAVTGHYTSMINPAYTYIGLGDFYTEASKYPNTLAGAFCSASNNLDQSMQAAQTDIMQKIEVDNSYIDSYVLEGNNTIVTGDTTELVLRANLVNGSSKLKLWVPGPLAYTSSDNSVAQVSDSGIVTGQNDGTATITAKSGNKELASILINVAAAETPAPETPAPVETPTPTPTAVPASQPPVGTGSPTASPSPTARPTQKPTASPSPSATPFATKAPMQTPLPSITETPAGDVIPDSGYEKPSGINVAYHTQEEIRNYAKKSNVSLEDALEFSEEPVTKKPYSLGKLSSHTLESALKMLNQVRYIAGISDNVELSDEYNTFCQAGALSNYVNNELSHFPEQPDGMPGDMYELAEKGAGSSNIAWASWKCSLNDTIVSSWMEDGDSGNIDRAGHRRWLINPSMGKTGFGAVYGNNGTYSCVYSFDRSNSSASEYGVAWPAQNMPLEYFGTSFPWSVSMGYDIDEDDVSVTLIRKNDGKTWKFSNSYSEGPFYVNNNGYGQAGCIIFRPDDIAYKAGDVFKVEITGLDNPVSYTVNFFELNPPAQEDKNNDIEKGTRIKDNTSNAVYKITGTGTNKTARYIKSTKKKPVNIIIPDIIKINGSTYKVTSIEKEAFKNSKKLKSVQIGKNISSIGQKAFFGCKKLSNITVKTNKLLYKSIGKKAFSKGNSKPTVKADKSKLKLYRKIFQSRGMSKKCKFKPL
ncbi:MAG: leucine-rich repeat protein [Lachnospiraceae bacterium]